MYNIHVNFDLQTNSQRDYSIFFFNFRLTMSESTFRKFQGKIILVS